MLEEANNLADIFRSSLPYYLLLALPILIICSSSPVLASSEFNVQRMSQFDVHGVPYGCRASTLSLEAKSLYTWSTGRHCVLAKLQDITMDQFREIRQKAGGLVVLLPKNVTTMTSDEKEHIGQLEQFMLMQSSNIPIYFSKYNEALEKVISDVTSTTADVPPSADDEPDKRRGTAFAELFNAISANGYQITASAISNAASKSSKIPIIQGELAPGKTLKQTNGGGGGNVVDGANTKLPLIILTAHLNTFGLFNEYPLNTDAAVLMTLANVFSKLYNTPNAVPKYRLMFLLSESGTLLNFQGVRKWLDENTQLQNLVFVLCLDTITASLGGADQGLLYMHVSKPPKEGTAMSNFFKLASTAGAKYNVSIDGVHKKINLADTHLAWEHERFSMKRLPAFTFSVLKSAKEPVRTTVFKDTDDRILQQTLLRTKIIAESLACYIYDIHDSEIFTGTVNIDRDVVKGFTHLQSVLHNNDLKSAFEKYLKNVKLIYERPDSRDPDFMFYEGQETTLSVYNVKPAVFDLFLTIVICVYLCAMYFVVKYFPALYSVICRMNKATVAINGSVHDRWSKAKSY